MISPPHILYMLLSALVENCGLVNIRKGQVISKSDVRGLSCSKKGCLPLHHNSGLVDVNFRPWYFLR